MNTRKLIFGFSVILIILVLLAGCTNKKMDVTEEEFYIPDSREEIYGTWVNTDYSGRSFQPQKIVNYHWGAYDIFMKADNDLVSYKGALTIIDKWTDSEGNIWYKSYFKENSTSGVNFELGKFSNNGNTWEFVFDSIVFPTEDQMNSAGPHYKIYYRQ
jgi:hypothetical protein